MPTCCGFCWECLGGGSDAYYCNLAKKQIGEVVPPYDKRMEWCPLKEVSPHGDLIDRSLVLEACHETARLWSLDMEGAFEVIENAPTIIEASKDGTEERE